MNEKRYIVEWLDDERASIQDEFEKEEMTAEEICERLNKLEKENEQLKQKIEGHEKLNRNCIECKHCIGEPTLLKIEGGMTQAYSCFKGNPYKNGMFDCREKACEFFEERG